MRLKSMTRIIGMTVLLLVLGAGMNFAQVTGKISGLITDRETGDELPGANVVIKGTTLGASADINGNFFVINVPAGTYTLVGTMIGYKSLEIENVRVSIGLTTEIDFKMIPTVLDAGETVTIVAERPLIQKDVTATTKIASQEQIQAIPVQTVYGAIATAPGTQGSGRNLHVRGGRAGEVQYLVDGISVEDPQTGNYALEVGREAVAEMQLISGGFNAEYGNAQSGVVLLTTREGAVDRYRGKVSYKTDDLSGSGLGENSENWDFVETSISGPEPITTYLFPMLGFKIPGSMNFFLQGDTQANDGRGDIRYNVTEGLRGNTVFNDWFGLGGRRDYVAATTNFKLTYNITPNHKLAFGYRSSNSVQLTHSWPNYYTSLMDVVSEGQALGISDGIDNDGDGRVDEEVFNGIDDDGDGVIDEYDAVFVDRAKINALSGWEFSWGLDGDGDGKTDEEAFNGIDDDGDGKIDEDITMPFDQNGFDIARRYDRDNRQLSLNWTHTLSEKTFYELRFSYNDFNYPIMPARGIKPGEYTTIDQLEDWVTAYDAAQAERTRLSTLRDQQIAQSGSSDIVVPDITKMIEPNWSFGTPSESYTDANANGKYDAGEAFTDWNNNGLWDYNNPTGESMYFEGQYHPFRGYIYQAYSQLFWNYKTTKYIGKFDITSQLNTNHQLKGGLEWNHMRLYSHLRQYLNPYNGRGLFSNQYDVFPNSAAFYVQDKMEFKSAIVNAGLRLEYFDPGSQVADEKVTDPLVPGYQLTKAGLTRIPEKRWSLLPRLGFSFPVTDHDVFHFFYGHFFQMPALDNVYNQANQRIDSANSIVGNPGLEPEKTISYEVGVRHSFGLNTMMSFSGFFKDIDNLMQIGKVEDVKGNVFRTYLNDTYGTVRGIELLLNQRSGQFLSGEASYTYQVATTSHSDSRDTYGLEDAFADLPGKEYPADWDQRHAITVNVDLHFLENQGPRLGNVYPLENWNLNILHTEASGLPYTPETASGTLIMTKINSLRTPWVRTTDVRMRKFFTAYGTRLGLILEVYNLFDRQNVIGYDEGGVIDAYRNRIGYSNGTPASRVANYGGFANSYPSPFAWEVGRRLRLGFSLEF